MSELKERAKRIIEKGKSLNDQELIDMGLEMLDQYEEIKPNLSRENITDQFRVEKKSAVDTKFGKKIPLSIELRPNGFVDDGTIAVELKGKTPEAKPKVKRKVDKVEKTCTACGKKQKILKDLLYTESYRCDNCIMKGKIK